MTRAVGCRVENNSESAEEEQLRASSEASGETHVKEGVRMPAQSSRLSESAPSSTEAFSSSSYSRLCTETQSQPRACRNGMPHPSPPTVLSLLTEVLLLSLLSLANYGPGYKNPCTLFSLL